MLKHVRRRREENRFADQLARDENAANVSAAITPIQARAEASIEEIGLEGYLLPLGERVWTDEDRKTAEATVKREAEARPQERFYIGEMSEDDMLDEEEYLDQMQDRRAEYMAELAGEMYGPEAAELRI